MKLRAFLLPLVVTLVGCSRPSQSQPSQSPQAKTTHVVTDMSGTKVKLPTKVNRVAALWHAHNPILMMLGAKKQVVATTSMIQGNQLLASVYPELKKQATPFNGNAVNIEALLATRPDVAISSDPAQVKQIKAAGVPAINAMFQDLAGMQKSVTLTAQVLNTKLAKSRASAYNQALVEAEQAVIKRTKGLAKPKVLHVVGLADLTKVDGTATIVDEWLRIAGGQNAVQEAGNMLTLTPEALLAADPDVIIVGSTTDAKALAAYQHDSRFAQLKAVKNKRVYGNPIGFFAWDRYSAEAALQIWWAGKLLHPTAFADVDLAEKAQAFYETHYHHHFTKEQCEAILAGKPVGQ